MFGRFAIDDNSYSSKNHASYRMITHMHNPYVGMFHGINRTDFSNNRRSNVVVDSKNPLLPMFRHAPPVKFQPGLKSLLFDDSDDKSNIKPFVTQVQVSQQNNQAKKRLTSDILRHLPLSIFDNSSSPTSVSDNDMPICPICLDCFKDGDELRTLECSHCYHRHCIDIWLIGCLSDEITDTCICPQCRQSIQPNLTQSSTDIPSSVFLRIGESLSIVDIVSDLTSDNGSCQELSCNHGDNLLEEIGDELITETNNNNRNMNLNMNVNDDGVISPSSSDLLDELLRHDDENDLEIDDDVIDSIIRDMNVVDQQERKNLNHPHNYEHTVHNTSNNKGDDDEEYKYIEEVSALGGSTYSDCGYPLG